MIRFLILLAVVKLSVTDDQNFDDIIAEIFGVSAEEDADNNNPSCNDVEGKGQGCYECYPCNNTLIVQNRNRGGLVELSLKDNTCSTTRICCITQKDLITYRAGDKCGQSNPDGKPRRRRPTVRAILSGEYPWRAWVYKKSSPSTPLCAATFINEGTKALITLASCVSGLSANSVNVAFMKGSQLSVVKDITIHPEYKAGDNKNDIAILRLRSLEATPRWILPACLPLAPPPHAAACQTADNRDTLINTVIPLRAACVPRGAAPAPPSLTCGVAPAGDYAPERGAPLTCKEQQSTSPAHIVYGIAITRQDDSVTTYINVVHFTDWIRDVLQI